MYLIQPFEIISHEENVLIMSYFTACKIFHDGMKEVLYSLSHLKGRIEDNEVEKLLHTHAIDNVKGLQFLEENGIITKIDKEKSCIWSNVVFFTDITSSFKNESNDWLKDDIIISGIYSCADLKQTINPHTSIWIHFEKYDSKCIKEIYELYRNTENIAFIQSYFIKEHLKIDGIFSPLLGTPCHFCHIERWLIREERSFKINSTSWSKMLNLVNDNELKLPVIKITNTDRGFVKQVIRRRLQELIGNPVNKLHNDTFINSLDIDIISCIPYREPVPHWHSCSCIRKLKNEQ